MMLIMMKRTMICSLQTQDHLNWKPELARALSRGEGRGMSTVVYLFGIVVVVGS